jgi:multidrug efflux pump subunit AcrB
MGIVRFALRYQHTFYVLALLMLFLGGSAIIVTPKDVFPSINVPVVTVIWQYTGLTPEEMDQRVTTYSEYAISTSVGDIRNIESQTLSGISVEKIFFQPNVNVETRHQSDRLGEQFHPRPNAGGHPVARHRVVQRVVRTGTATQPQFRPAE